MQLQSECCASREVPDRRRQASIIEPALSNTDDPNAETVQFRQIGESGRSTFASETVQIGNEENAKTTQTSIPKHLKKGVAAGAAAGLLIAILLDYLEFPPLREIAELLKLVRDGLPSVICGYTRVDGSPWSLWNFRLSGCRAASVRVCHKRSILPTLRNW